MGYAGALSERPFGLVFGDRILRVSPAVRALRSAVGGFRSPYVALGFALLVAAATVRQGRGGLSPAGYAPWAALAALGANDGTVPEGLEEYVDRYRERFVRSFLDWVVLSILVRKRSYGYEMIAMISEEFNLYLSSGTLYPVLYNLERMHLVTGRWDSPNRRSKKVYEITPEGLRVYREGLETLNRLLGSTRLGVDLGSLPPPERIHAPLEAPGFDPEP